jgi:dTDP-L-rhamnose 4-epimerase
MKRSTVVVTGGAGFIGRHVVTAALAAGHEVGILDSLEPSVHPHPPTIAGGVELIRADVRDTAAVEAALRGVDVVVHLAAKVGLGVRLADMADYASTNDVGTASVLTAAAAAAADVCSVVLASSMVVYGDGRYRCPEHGEVAPGPRTAQRLSAGDFEPPCPVCGARLTPGLTTESAPPDPRNSYAVSKLAQEHYSRVWADMTGGRVAALRYHNVYGPGMPRDTPYAGIAAVFRSQLLAGGPPQVFEDGRQRRDFVHVRDVAAATVAAIEPPRTGDIPPGFRVYNVGSGQVRTVGDLAAAMSGAVGGPPPVVTGRFRVGDVRHITASAQRAQDELGWLPVVPFADGIAELAKADDA